LDQRLSLEEKQKWVAKLQGFDFEIIYKMGKDNAVADALSIIEEASSLYSITSSILLWLEEARHEWKNDKNTRHKIQCTKEGMNSMEDWYWKRDILWYKGRIFVCPQSKLKQ
jgi:hypothetical protein